MKDTTGQGLHDPQKILVLPLGGCDPSKDVTAATQRYKSGKATPSDHGERGVRVAAFYLEPSDVECLEELCLNDWDPEHTSEVSTIDCAWPVGREVRGLTVQITVDSEQVYFTDWIRSTWGISKKEFLSKLLEIKNAEKPKLARRSSVAIKKKPAATLKLVSGRVAATGGGRAPLSPETPVE